MGLANASSFRWLSATASLQQKVNQPSHTHTHTHQLLSSLPCPPPPQVAMSKFDSEKYIDYGKLATNVSIVKDRSAIFHSSIATPQHDTHNDWSHFLLLQVAATFDPLREGAVRSP